MKKTLFYSLLLLMVTFAKAQNYCSFLPYSLNNKYGLVNDKQEKIVAPQYTKLELLGDFSFALFDDVHCYSLSTGKYVKITSSQYNSFVIIENGLFIFNSKLNTLVNPYTNEKIPLKLKYKLMYTRTFFDYKSKKAYDLIFAYTIDEKQFFFKNNKNLPTAIPGKYNFKDFDLFGCTFDTFDRNIGIMVVNSDKSISCYNYDASKSFRIDPADFEEVTEYSIQFKKNVHQKFVDFYGFESESYPESFSLSSIGAASSGRFFNRFIETIQLGNGYSLKKEGYNFKLKTPSGIRFKDVVFDDIYHFDYSDTALYLKLTKSSTKEEVQMFVNHPKINPDILMLPKEELIRFELIK